MDQHPTVNRCLYEELDAKLSGVSPELEQVAQLTYLDHVVKECLRLFPPSPFGLRYAAKDVEIGGHRIKTGVGVFFSSYVTHRLREIFPDPLKFKPERWDTAKPGAYEYFPFGAGLHNCIANKLSLMEVKVILIMILQRFRLRLLPACAVDLTVRISLVPKQGTIVKVGQSGAPDLESPVSVKGTVNSAVDLKH